MIVGQVSRDERSRQTAVLMARLDRSTDAVERAGLQQEVVVLNCRVADAVAARYRDRGVPLEDLRQAAYEGLVKAVQRFDPAHAEDLLTFAVPTIRGEVQRHFRDRSWMVRPPRRVQELQTLTGVVVPELRRELGREPTHAEIGERLGIGAVEYAEMVTAFGCFSPTSLDSLVVDLVADESAAQTAAEARCVLAPAVRTLDHRDRQLLVLRFYEERSQREIAELMGLSQSQVSRLLERVLRDLRRSMGPEPLSA